MANWPAAKATGRPSGLSAIFGYPRADVQDVDDLVVQQGHEVAGQHLTVEVKGQASPADGDEAPAQQGGVAERRAVQQAVGEAGGDEQAGQPVEGAPPRVPAGHHAQPADPRDVAHGQQWPVQDGRDQRAPPGQDGPPGEDEQARHAGHGQRHAQA